MVKAEVVVQIGGQRIDQKLKELCLNCLLRFLNVQFLSPDEQLQVNTKTLLESA